MPYRGAANQLTDTAGGSIDMTFVSLGGARPFIKDGRVRAIAMTSPARSPLAPDLPAVAETPGLENTRSRTGSACSRPRRRRRPSSRSSTPR